MLARFLCLGIAIAAALLLVSATPAAAQEWLADRERAEGRGIRLGNFELHPGIGSEIGYDSNVFLSDEDNEKSSAVLRIAPHLFLSTLSGERLQGEQPRISLRAGVNGSLRHYFATSAGTDMAVGQDLTFAWNASRIFRVEIYDAFVRSVDPFTEPGAPTPDDPTAGSDGDLNYARDQLGVGTRLQLSTPGQLIKGGLGYRFDIDHFEGAQFAGNRSRSHTISADDSWEFLPKTALFWNGELSFQEYVNPGLAVGARNDGTTVSSKIGINGALTQRIGFTVAGGYSAGFFADDNDFENPIVQLELRWKPEENLLWALGYDRESATAFQGNYQNMDRVKTRLQGMFGGVVVLGLAAELTFVDFGRDERLTDPERDDVQLVTKVSGEYRVVDWFAITGQVGYMQNFSDYEYALDASGGDDPLDSGLDDPDGDDDPAGVNGAAYKRFDAFLGVRAFL
jgi:hypothetical protein